MPACTPCSHSAVRDHLQSSPCLRPCLPSPASPRTPPDYYTLLRFLRARNYELDKAMKMWLDTLEWRKEYDVDTILDSFMFHEREQFLMAYPQGYHKTDKLVSSSTPQHTRPCKC